MLVLSSLTGYSRWMILLAVFYPFTTKVNSLFEPIRLIEHNTDSVIAHREKKSNASHFIIYNILKISLQLMAATCFRRELAFWKCSLIKIPPQVTFTPWTVLLLPFSCSIQYTVASITERLGCIHPALTMFQTLQLVALLTCCTDQLNKQIIRLN